MEMVRITAPKDGKTLGSKVITPSGHEVPGITRVVLIGEAEDLWHARVECLASFDEINAVPDFDMKGIKEQVANEMLDDPVFSSMRKLEIKEYLDRLHGN